MSQTFELTDMNGGRLQVKTPHESQDDGSLVICAVEPFGGDVAAVSLSHEECLRLSNWLAGRLAGWHREH